MKVEGWFFMIRDDFERFGARTGGRRAESGGS